MLVSFTRAASLLGKSRSLLVRLRNDGRLEAGGYLVPSTGPGVLDKIEMEPAGKMPLAQFCELWSQYHPPAAEEPEAEAEDLEPADGLPGLPRSRRAKLHWDARNAELNYQERAAALINKAVVEKVLAGAVRQVHEILGAVPSKVVTALSPLTPAQGEQVREILAREVSESLVGLGAIRFDSPPLEDEGELVPV